MATLDDIVRLADQWLLDQPVKDYCPNGLQVEGRAEVRRIVSGVTACQALLDRAVECQADLVLVHHGYFWRGEAQTLTGLRKQRIATLLQHDISLLAYHLPLDLHPELGNNVMLARQLGWQVTGPLPAGEVGAIGLQGTLPQACTAAEFARQLHQGLDRQPLHIAATDRPIRRLAWCTGAAQGFLSAAVDAGVDAYVSGEISEPTVHLAREAGIHYFAAGHHATERYGVQALGSKLAAATGVQHQFIDIDNPV